MEDNKEILTEENVVVEEQKPKQIKFRNLRADEIDVRVGQVKDNGFSLLLYQDSRCAMDILDEAVGVMNWKREHTRDNANCIISIWDESKQQWVSKEDTGTESRTEAEKGLASDSFKRSAVNWGIGRALYTSPFIWINVNIKDDKGNLVKFNDKYDKFAVEKIAYNEKDEIIGLSIINTSKNNKRVFLYQKETIKK